MLTIFYGKVDRVPCLAIHWFLFSEYGKMDNLYKRFFTYKSSSCSEKQIMVLCDANYPSKKIKFFKREKKVEEKDLREEEVGRRALKIIIGTA